MTVSLCSWHLLMRCTHISAGSAPVLQAAQDGDGVRDGGLAHIHLLEAPLQRRVLLNVLPVLVLPYTVFLKL